MTPLMTPSLGRIVQAAAETSFGFLAAHPFVPLLAGILSLPLVALIALRPQPMLSTPNTGDAAMTAVPMTVRPVQGLQGLNPVLAPAMNQLESDALRALRRLSRERGSAMVREEARRKLLQLQSRVRYAEGRLRRSHENELNRLLIEAARYGITVTPEETLATAV